MITFQFLPFPEFTTNRLVLRRFIASDAAALFLLRSDPRVMKYLDRPLFSSEEDALRMIEAIDAHLASGEGITWGLELLNAPGIIGTIGYYRNEPQNHRGEIGYLLQQEQQGKGLMQEAMEAAIAYGFGPMQLHTIKADINPANEKSRRILERNGFIQEANFRENYYYNGRFLDSAIFGLVNPADDSR